jgi:hypothetical protein
VAFPRRGAAIVGVYLTKQARKIADKTSVELEIEAMKKAHSSIPTKAPRVGEWEYATDRRPSASRLRGRPG